MEEVVRRRCRLERYMLKFVKMNQSSYYQQDVDDNEKVVMI